MSVPQLLDIFLKLKDAIDEAHREARRRRIDDDIDGWVRGDKQEPGS